MKRYLKIWYPVFAFLLLGTGVVYAKSASTDAKIITIPYGNGFKINYNLNTGTYDVYAGTQKIIVAAYSLVKLRGESLSSTGYQQINYTQRAVKDQFGKGKRFSILLNKVGKPQMEQVFYVYPGLDYFFTEVLLKGQYVESNYMAPLVANEVNLYAKGDNVNLFVPFDNDAFIRYNAKSMQQEMSNTSSEVGAFYENNSRKGLIIGSVEHMVWKTGVSSKGIEDKLSELTVFGGYSEEKVTRDKVAHGFISGMEIKSPRIFAGYFADWRLGLEAYGKANRIVERPYVFNWTAPTPFGWNSWGVIQDKITYEKAIKVADFFAEELPAFRNGNTAYIDLDSFWDNFTGGMHGDFSKLKEFADYCKSKGLQPGVYWAPFTDWGFQSGGNRGVLGSDYKFSELWTKVNGGYHDFDGARAIDPTHPGTKKLIDYIIKKLNDCGFKMIKIDFLGHAAAEGEFYDKSVTTGMQAYRVGMEYLTDKLDGKMLIYAAISPSMATGRYAHVRRIACDAWKTIKDTEYTLNSVNYGWWQTYVYNYLDADHVVFGNESEGANKARLTSALITGTVIMGDDFSAEGEWKARAKQLLKNEGLLDIARSGEAFMPLDGNTGEQSNEIFTKTIDGYLYIAALNFGSKAKDFTISMNRLGLKGASYEAVELFDRKEIKANNVFKFSLNGADAAIFKVKIR